MQDLILEKVRDILDNKFVTTEIVEGNDLIIDLDKIKYTITTTANQRDNKNKNITTINLGQCEEKLKEKYKISKNDSLYILKIDVIINNIQKVEYEVYYLFNKNNLTKLDLTICKNIKIDISIPIELSIDEIDIYNKSSALYNDICYTSSNDKTDKTLKDRQDDYKNNNISICEEDCDFNEYDNKNKKAICNCYTKIKLPLISEIKVDKEKLFSNFKNINNIGNFIMLKCFMLLFDKKNFLKNSANYLVIILFTINIITLFVFVCYDYLKIKQLLIKFTNKKEANKQKVINRKNFGVNNINNKKNKLSKNNTININKEKNTILNIRKNFNHKKNKQIKLNKQNKSKLINNLNQINKNKKIFKNNNI